MDARNRGSTRPPCGERGEGDWKGSGETASIGASDFIISPHGDVSKLGEGQYVRHRREVYSRLLAAGCLESNGDGLGARDGRDSTDRSPTATHHRSGLIRLVAREQSPRILLSTQ